MPTNDFQELIRTIEQLLGSKGVKIRSPVMVQAQGLPDFREVDILLEDELGPYSIKVAIEATKLGRPLGVAKYDSICKKYTGEGKVAVDKFVIVTEKGFTRDVLRKAERENVELITVAEAIGGKRTEAFTQRPLFICNVECTPQITEVTTKEILDVGEIYCEGDKSQIRCLVNVMLTKELPEREPNFFTDILKRAIESPNGIVHYKFGFDVRSEAKLVVGDKEFSLTSIQFYLHQQVHKGVNSTTCFERVSTKGGKTQIVQAKMATGHGPIEATFSFGRDGKTPGEKAIVKFPPEYLAELFKKAAAQQMMFRKVKRSQVGDDQPQRTHGPN